MDDGGLKETIVHEQTGYLIGKQADTQDIIKAVKYMSLERCESMQEACKNRAELFSLETFETTLKELIQKH